MQVARLALCSLLLLIGLTATAWAVSPALVPVQGQLTDATGTPVEGPLDVTFTLYADPSGATPLWSETQNVAFEGGAFAVYLGSDTPMDLALFKDFVDVYLGVAVGADAEMPLVRLGTAPFAGYATFCGQATTFDGMTREQMFTDFESRIGDTTHARYTDAEAVAAMGALGDTNPLNHNRFSPSDAVASMGAAADTNPLNHNRYTNAEAVAAMGTLGPTNPLNHARYTDAEAIAAVAGDGSFLRTVGSTATDLTVGTLTVTGALTGPTLPTAQTYASVVRVQSRGYSSTIGDAGVWVDGNRVLAPARSYGLVAIERATGTVAFAQNYDVYGDATKADELAAQLATYSADHIIVLMTYDEPRSNRLVGALPAQILRCGGSPLFLSSEWRSRSAYALVGICDMGPGTGIEQYAGDVDSDTTAFVDITFQILDGGLTLGSYRSHPRVIHTTDPRGGCPPAAPAGTDLFTQTFDLVKPAQVSIQADVIRSFAGRADMQLFVDGAQVDQTLTYTPAADGAQWEDCHTAWGGVLGTGPHTVSVRGSVANAFGCGPTWGSITTTIFE